MAVTSQKSAPVTVVRIAKPITFPRILGQRGINTKFVKSLKCVRVIPHLDFCEDPVKILIIVSRKWSFAIRDFFVKKSQSPQIKPPTLPYWGVGEFFIQTLFFILIFGVKIFSIFRNQ